MKNSLLNILQGKILFFFLLISNFLNTNLIHAQGFNYYLDLPENSGMWNMKTDFGAVGDGITDDTKALLEAFRGDSVSYSTGEQEGGYRAVYIPPGIYLVNKPLPIGDKKKVILGAGKDSVIIRLVPNTEGFQDPENPGIFIDALAGQYQAQNFWIFIKHLTIEIGEGNPGAIALSFHTNNTGGVYDVDIRSADPGKAGYCGMQLKSWPGPGIIKHVTIDGFDYGIRVSDDQYSMTFEDVVIRNSKITAFYNYWNTCSIRKLNISNVTSGLVTIGPQSMVSLIDSEIEGNGETAVQCLDNGLMLVRNLTASGFNSAITSETDTVAGPIAMEWHSHPAGSVFPSRNFSLNLPVEETPEFPYENDSTRYAVITYQSGDFASAMQAAIDSGMEAIYLAPAWGKPEFQSAFPFSKTIIIRNNVKRIMGLGNTIITPNITGKPAFRIEDGSADTVIFQNIYTNYGVSYSYLYEHASKRTLVLQNGAGSYHNVVDSCVLFVEDMVGSPFIMTNMTAWIRDLNTESYDHIHVENNNSKVWTLGHKTEKDQTIYKTTNGGKTEVLGGLFYKNNEHAVHPMLIVDGGEGTFSYREKGLPYLVHMEETREGELRYFVSTWTYSSRMALLSASQGNVPDEPLNITATALSSDKVEITWSDSSDNEEGFIVLRSKDGVTFITVDSLPAGQESYIDTGLTASTKYYYYVVSYASDGNSLHKYNAPVEVITSGLNIEQQNIRSGIEIYPVPANDKISIQVSNDYNLKGTVKIYSISGILMKEINPGNSRGIQISLDVTSIANGIYIIELSNGVRLYRKKIFVFH